MENNSKGFNFLDFLKSIEHGSFRTINWMKVLILSTGLLVVIGASFYVGHKWPVNIDSIPGNIIGFRYPVSITSVSPSSADIGETITIKGRGFDLKNNYIYFLQYKSSKEVETLTKAYTGAIKSSDSNTIQFQFLLA